MLNVSVSTSGLRALRPEDFPAEQLNDWIAASGSAARDTSRDEPAAADGDWFVAYTNPKREGSVERTCRQRGFETYVPAMTVTQRRQSAQRPVFPRYVFVRLRDGLTLYGLRETPGLEALVRDADGRHARVPQSIILGLRCNEDCGDWDFTEAKAAETAAAEAADAQAAYEALFVPGFRVRIRGGSYQRFSGFIVERLDAVRMSVRLKLFGREFEIPLPLADLVPF